MSKLFGFFGTHGVGKTTIVNELSARGYAVDTLSVPRLAQAKLGWPNLREVEKSEANLWAMQDLTLKLLIERDARIAESGAITFVDRTPVDVAGYAATWAIRRNWDIDLSRYEEFVDACNKACEQYRLQFFVPIREEIPFVPEHNRGDEMSRQTNQSSMIEAAFRRPGHTWVIVHPLAVKDRADEVVQVIEALE